MYILSSTHFSSARSFNALLWLDLPLLTGEPTTDEVKEVKKALHQLDWIYNCLGDILLRVPIARVSQKKSTEERRHTLNVGSTVLADSDLEIDLKRKGRQPAEQQYLSHSAF